VVFHDRDLLGIGDAVGPDHRMGAHEATRHLIGLGHRRIALMTPSASIRPGRERLAGYRAALQEAGIPHDPDLEAMLEASGGDMAFSATKRMLGHTQRPTAVICLGTQMLAGVMSAVGTLGLSVPGELSLIGIGDTELVRLSTPPITAVRWDIAQCGRWAAQMMLERLRNEGEERPYRMLEVPTEMVLRHSCAPPTIG
jgi:LacI family transcriptional regulator